MGFLKKGKRMTYIKPDTYEYNGTPYKIMVSQTAPGEGWMIFVSDICGNDEGDSEWHPTRKEALSEARELFNKRKTVKSLVIETYANQIESVVDNNPDCLEQIIRKR